MSAIRQIASKSALRASTFVRHSATAIAVVLATAGMTLACGGSGGYRPRARVVVVQPRVVHVPVQAPAPNFAQAPGFPQPQAQQPVVDLQLLSVRLVDGGNADQNVGPRYRVFVRNASPLPVNQQFGVVVLAGPNGQPTPQLPRAGAQVVMMQPGQVLPVDIRLPAEANNPELQTLHVFVDSHRQVGEQNKNNNAGTIARASIQAIDPAVFASDAQGPAAGGEINLTGEGLGSFEGKAIVRVGGMDLQGEVTGWSEQGVRVKLPSLPLANPTAAQVVLMRIDGKTANPLTVTITPTSNVAGASAPNRMLTEPRNPLMSENRNPLLSLFGLESDAASNAN